MRKFIITMAAVATVAAGAVAGLPQVIRSAMRAPKVNQHNIERRVTASARPSLTPRDTAGDLQAAFSIQGATSQQSVWSENFDNGASGWALGMDQDNYFGWELKQTTDSHA